MFGDETCLNKLATMLVGASVAGAATAGVTLAPGVSESLGAGVGLLTRLSGQRRADAERVLKSLQADLTSEWRAWGAHSSHADKGLRESVVASFEVVITHCALLPAELVGRRLDPDAVAEAVLRKATAVLPEVYSDPDPRNADARLARAFLLNVTRRAYARLIAEPGYIDTLAPQLWQDVLAWQERMEEKQNAQSAMLRELLARTAPSLPLAAARAILAEFGDGEAPEDAAGIERLLRNAAEQFRLFKDRLRELDNSGDLAVRDLLREAEALVAAGRFDDADARLVEAERHADLARAKVRANRADLAKLRLRYREAAAHYAAAADIVPPEEREVRWRYEKLRADVLQTLGDEFGENAALVEAIDLYGTTVLALAPRDRAPIDWAATQNNLGLALVRLGKRDGKTARLEQAVVACHAALEERTRERAPRDWAATQNNLGNALLTLGERESDTARLEQAVAAYRAALEEQTRGRAPLRWAMTQNNLGLALLRLGSGRATRRAWSRRSPPTGPRWRSRAASACRWTGHRPRTTSASRCWGSGSGRATRRAWSRRSPPTAPRWRSGPASACRSTGR
jgi:tetratricopeptide (TPR) repeat protein